MIGLGEILVLAAFAVGMMVLLGFLRIYVRRQAKDRFSIEVQVGRQPATQDQSRDH